MTDFVDELEIVAFMPTPFTDDCVDENAVIAQMQHYREYDLTVGILGGLGEFYAMSYDESAALMKASVAGIGERGRVLAALGFATREAIKLGVAARDAGCSGIIINPPYYATPSPRGFADHVRAVTEASGLDAVVYSSKHLAVTDQYVEELVKVDGFRGVKDELSSPTGFGERVARWGDRVSFWAVGEHTGREFISEGARVVTSALANVCPEATREHLTGTEPTGELSTLVHESVRILGVEAGTGSALTKEMIAAVRPWPTQVRAPQSSPSEALRSRTRELVVTLRGRYG